MKILQVMNHFWPCVGGMEEVAKAVSENLLKEEIEVRILCLNKCSKGKQKLKAKHNWKNIAIERIPFIDLKFYKIAPSILFKLNDADIVHIHGIGFFSDFLLLTKFLHRKKIVLHTHGGIFHTSKKSISKKIYFYVWQRLLLRFADKIIAVSKQDAELFSKIACRKKIVLIENGINLQEFKTSKKIPNTFLFVGRISGNKRIDLLLKAFAGIVQKIPNARLSIVGPDWENLQKELEELLKNLKIEKNVLFFGELERTQILGQYSVVEFFVSASEYEGFGITALEACASECIPLLNRIQAFENILGRGNKLLIDYSDANEAAEQILEIMHLNEKQKNEIRKKCFEIALRSDWKEKVKQLIEEYEDIYNN